MSDIAARARATDHNIHPDLAKELRAIAAVPMDLRRPALRRLAAKIGNAAMVDLFGEFIGLANQVAFNACEQAKDLLVLQGHVWPHEAERINMPCILGASTASCYPPASPLAHSAGAARSAPALWPTSASRPRKTPTTAPPRESVPSSATKPSTSTATPSAPAAASPSGAPP